MGLFDILKKKNCKQHRNIAKSGLTSNKCTVCGNNLNSSNMHKVICYQCEWTQSKYSENKEIFKIAKNNRIYNLTYCGHSRFSPNRSMRSGYGSDDWFYLCKENTKHYLLQFTDNAEFGTGWMATELLSDDYDKLINEGVDFWGSIAYSKERKRIYAIRLTEVDSVRHLLPVSSRCCGKLTDKDYLR